MAEGRAMSPWAWVGIGCGCLVILMIAGFVTCGVVLKNFGEELEAEMSDPVARADKVREILRYETLPEGYYPAIGFAAPFGLMKTAILTTEESSSSQPDVDLDGGGFIYFMLIRFGGTEQELDDFFAGRTNDPSVLRRNNINVDVDQIIDRGMIETDDATLSYLVQTGGVDVEGTRAEGLTSVIRIVCPGDKKLRVGVWTTPTEAEVTDLSGTNGDAAEIEKFMSHFRFCGGDS